MYYVYLLYNLNPNSKRKFYIGVTNDLKRRVEEHNSREKGWTSGFGPWKLVYCEIYLSWKDADNREWKLKHHGKGLSELKKRVENSIQQLLESPKNAGIETKKVRDLIVPRE